MICSRFDYYSPYVLFYVLFYDWSCVGAFAGPTLHFRHKNLFFTTLRLFICFLMLSLEEVRKNPIQVCLSMLSCSSGRTEGAARSFSCQKC